MTTDTKLPPASPKAQWYTRRGEPVTEVPTAKGDKTRRPTIKDAKAMRLLPDAGIILRIIGRFESWDSRLNHLVRLALSYPAVSREGMDAAVAEVKQNNEQACEAALAFACEFRRHAMALVSPNPGDIPAPHASIIPWLESFQNNWLRKMQRVYWSDSVLLSSRGFAVRADLMVAHPTWGPTLVDIRCQGSDGLPKLQTQWLYKLAASRLILGPGVPCCTLVLDTKHPGSIVEVWWSPDQMANARLGFLSALKLWRYLTGYHPRRREKKEVA